MMKCNLCGKEIKGFGNNPDPLIENDDDRCCDECNDKYVIPMRIYMLEHKMERGELLTMINKIRKENGYDK